MQAFERRPSGWAIARRAWSSVLAAFRAMPVLFLGALFLGAGLGVAFLVVASLQTAMAAPKLEALGVSTLAAHIGVHFLSTLAWSVLAAPVAVAIHRFVLLEETTPLLSYTRRHTRLFFLWATALQLCFFAARTFPLVMSSVMFVRGLAELLVNIGIVIVAIRLMLVFPAIATDVPAPSAEKRIDVSFMLTDGKFLRIVWAGFLAFLPFILLSLGGLLMFPKLIARQGAVHPMHALNPAIGVLTGLFGILWIMLAAALASWIYAWTRQEKDY